MSLLNHTTGYTPASAAIRNRIGNCLSRIGELINFLVAALIAQRARQANLVLLRSLNDRDLRDIGLYRCQIDSGLSEAAERRSRKQDDSRR